MRLTVLVLYPAFAAFIFIGSALGFNINTDTIFRQYSGNDDSYFGYALEFMDKHWLLVGAPKDNDTFIPAVFEPGRLLRCRISDNGSCEPLSVDNKTDTDKIWNIHFTHGRDRSWLGASIDVPLENPNKGIVVCAPRWYNRQHVNSGEYFMNGLCYTIPVDLNVVNIEKFPILVPGSNQVFKLDPNTTIIIHGMATMGWSAHYTATNTDLLFGAPGLVQWTGGFVRKMAGQQFAEMKSSYEDVFTTHNQYIGYSITSGNYFLDNLEYYVVGAPRADLIGKVYFFRGGLNEYHLNDTSLELTFRDADIKELPMNSYFGASLCTVDVNADGFDDLLVGAPLYGNISSLDPKQDLIDVGRAYLYLGNKKKTEFEMNVKTFCGDMKTGARFGSAITSLGDINKDGFNDVAIGAPYEDDWTGAVYVYNGYKGGLWDMYSQKIVARQLDSGLRAFGHAISKSMDVNSDDIKDVAIGSYLSGHVTVLLGQPVINMKATMEVRETGSGDDLNVIDKNSNKTYVKACFAYKYRYCTRVVLNVTISLDTEKGELSRVYFNKIQRPSMNIQLNSFSGDKSCSNSEEGRIFFKPTFDLVSPVVIRVEYEMVDSTCPAGSNPTISKFNGQNPGDPLLLLTKKLQIKNECPNNTCSTDLHLDAVAVYENVNGFFVVGTPNLTLNISVTKSGDPSYGSLFRMTIPNTLLYRKMEQVSGSEVVTCSLENAIDDESSVLEKYKNESLLECSLGNPLKENYGVAYLLHLQIPNSITDDFVQFRMEASTLSKELDQKDNIRILEIKMKNHVETSLSGVTNPDTLLIQEQTDSYDLTHVYELENRGPSLLPAANIKIYYPQIQSVQTASLYLNRTKVRCRRPCEMECTNSSEYKLPSVWMDSNGRSYYLNPPPMEAGLTALRYLGSYILNQFPSIVMFGMKGFYVSASGAIQDHHGPLVMNCEAGPCLVYDCTLTNLAPQQSVSVTLDFVVLKQVEGILKSQKSLEITSVAKAHLNAPNLISNKTHSEYKLKTVLLPRVPPKTGVDWWIILVSVLGGLILIAILIFVLYKVGFFKRKRFPQPPPKADIEKEKLSDEKASVSLTDSEHDIIDKNEKQEVK